MFWKVLPWGRPVLKYTALQKQIFKWKFFLAQGVATASKTLTTANLSVHYKYMYKIQLIFHMIS